MRKEGAISATIEAQIAFHDVDMVQIVWHGHYLKYLENARWALMDKLGFGLSAMQDSGYGWPVVDLRVKYINVARFGDRLEVRASLAEWEQRLVVNYLITKCEGRQRVLRAQTTQVAVEAATGALQFPTPRVLLERVSAATAATKDK